MEIKVSEIRKNALKGLGSKRWLSLGLIFLSLFGFLNLFIISELVSESLKGNQIIIETTASLILRISFNFLALFLLNWHYQTIMGIKFKNLSKKLLLFLTVSVLIVFEGLFFYLIPFSFDVVIEVSRNSFVGSYEMFLLLDILKIFFYLLAEIFHFIYSLRYFLCPFIIANEPKARNREVIASSVRKMRNEKNEAAVFILSTARFLVYSLFILPAFHYLPKFFASIAVFGEYKLEKNRMMKQNRSYN